VTEPTVVVLCTGNAARSVMAGAMLEALDAPVRVVTAGTHVLEHQPMSIRTRAALAAVGLEAPAHRSHQLTDADVEAATLIVAMEADHVRYVRRRHAAGADRTATIGYLVDHLPAGADPLGARVARLALAGVAPEHQPQVADPAGGEDPVYVSCAVELSGLVDQLLGRLGDADLVGDAVGDAAG